MTIFHDDADYRQFVHLMGDVIEEFGIQCWNYCLMPNHYHTTLQPARPNLSEAIRRLNSNYAQWWNRRHERVGHVFQGRFKAQIVDRDTYLFALSRYVMMNPVRAGLVDQPEDWAWSSYRATVGLCSTPSFLASSLTLRLFGDGGDADLQALFAKFVTGPPEDPGQIDRIRSNEQILGTRTFKDFVASSSLARIDSVSPSSDPGRTPV